MADYSQPQDDAGVNGEVDDRSEVVDANRSKVFEMDRSNAIKTEGLEKFSGLDGGGHL